MENPDNFLEFVKLIEYSKNFKSEKISEYSSILIKDLKYVIDYLVNLKNKFKNDPLMQQNLNTVLNFKPLFSNYLCVYNLETKVFVYEILPPPLVFSEEGIEKSTSLIDHVKNFYMPLFPENAAVYISKNQINTLLNELNMPQEYKNVFDSL